MVIEGFIELIVPLAAYLLTIICSGIITRTKEGVLAELLRTGPELCKLSITFLFITIFLPNSEWLEHSFVGQSEWKQGIIASLVVGLLLACIFSYLFFHAIERKGDAQKSADMSRKQVLNVLGCQLTGILSWVITIQAVG